MKKYLTAFISGLLSDFWLSACTYCVNHDSFAALFFFNLTYPIINLIGIASVVETKDKQERFKLACTIGLGYAIGSSIFFLYFREYFK
jgi:hypothetical protein